MDPKSPVVCAALSQQVRYPKMAAGLPSYYRSRRSQQSFSLLRNDTMRQILEADGADSGAHILGRTRADSGWQKPDLPSHLIVSRLYL